MKPSKNFGKSGRLRSNTENKRYFMSLRQMREDKWYQSIMHSLINRGMIVGAIEVASGNNPCSCGCGTLATVVYPPDPPLAPIQLRNIKAKRLVFIEANGKIIKD